MAIIAPAPEDLNLGQVENEEVLTLLECPVCLITYFYIFVSFQLFRNKRFALNKMLQRNASKFAIFDA